MVDCVPPPNCSLIQFGRARFQLVSVGFIHLIVPLVHCKDGIHVGLRLNTTSFASFAH